MARIFNNQEIRGIALLMPLVLLCVWLIADSFSADKSTAEKNDTTPIEEVAKPAITPFDPNTVTYEELRTMGIDKPVARNIVKYREGGRTYSLPEDVAMVYGVSDSLYALLKPHIVIAEE